MKNHIVLFSLFATSLFYSQPLIAQGLAVNTTGVAANASAMLDVARSVPIVAGDKLSIQFSEINGTPNNFYTVVMKSQ